MGWTMFRFVGLASGTAGAIRPDLAAEMLFLGASVVAAAVPTFGFVLVGRVGAFKASDGRS